jgi:aryl-alcohol dehydrogenase-like predicted oxidoreductase
VKRGGSPRHERRYTNEALVGRAIKDRRDQVVLATNFGIVSHAGGGPGVLDSSPANIRAAVEGSLTPLATEHIDLCYQHRVDPNTPIEDTVGALATLVAEGKVRDIGLSEAPPRFGWARPRGASRRRCRPSTRSGPVNFSGLHRTARPGRSSTQLHSTKEIAGAAIRFTP